MQNILMMTNMNKELKKIGPNLETWAARVNCYIKTIISCLVQIDLS